MGAEFYDLVSEWKSNFPYLKVNAARIDLFLGHDCFSIRFWTRTWGWLARRRGWKWTRGFRTRVLVNGVCSRRRLLMLTCHQGWRKTFAQSSLKFWRFDFDVQQFFDFFLDRCLFIGIIVNSFAKMRLKKSRKITLTCSGLWTTGVQCWEYKVTLDRCRLQSNS